MPDKPDKKEGTVPDKTALLESRWAFDDDQSITDFRSRHRRRPLRDDRDSDRGSGHHDYAGNCGSAYCRTRAKSGTIAAPATRDQGELACPQLNR
ncbi:hypothetical protein [Nocardia vinacea]|uniref:hypothetical protein n=1 Tax=Nocardia vinacea TaxID=96468 RepID=UPI0002DDBB7A|nr:hypothetical protein [Nocardia vinacea]